MSLRVRFTPAARSQFLAALEYIRADNYRVKADTVWVVAVWHGAQIPGEPGDVERV